MRFWSAKILKRASLGGKLPLGVLVTDHSDTVGNGVCSLGTGVGAGVLFFAGEGILHVVVFLVHTTIVENIEPIHAYISSFMWKKLLKFIDKCRVGM